MAGGESTSSGDVITAVGDAVVRGGECVWRPEGVTGNVCGGELWLTVAGSLL